MFLNAGNRVMITRERENAEKNWKDAVENGWVERLFAVNYHKTLLHIWRLVPIISLIGSI